MAHVDVQGPEHFHRRHLRLRDQDADHVQDRMLQGRYRILYLPLSALHLQGKRNICFQPNLISQFLCAMLKDLCN